MSLILPGQALHLMTPSRDFRTTVNTAEFTKALYIAEDAGATTFNIYNEITEANVSFKTGGIVLPVQTKAAVTISGYSVVYLY